MGVFRIAVHPFDERLCQRRRGAVVARRRLLTGLARGIQPRDQLVVRRFVSESLSGLIDTLTLLDVGEVLILGDAMLLPTRVKLNKPKIEPASVTRDFWTDWGTDRLDPR